MSSRIVTGGAGGLAPKVTRRSFSFKPGAGLSARLDYRGNDVGQAIDLFNAQVFGTIGADLVIERGGATVALNYGHDPGGSTPASNALSLTQDRWEMPSEETVVSIWTHPRCYAAVAAIVGTITGGSDLETAIRTDAEIQRVIGILRGGADATPPTQPSVMFGADALDPLTSLDTSTGDGLTVLNYYTLACTGSNTYRKSKAVIKHSTSVPAYWTRNVGSDNANCIYTHDQMLAETGNAFLWNQILPARLAYKATDIYSQAPPDKLNYVWGWLKNFTGEAYAGHGKIEITCDYILDQWSLLAYDAAV